MLEPLFLTNSEGDGLVQTVDRLVDLTKPRVSAGDVIENHRFFRLRTEGTVRVRFLVRRDGTVGEIIIEAADPEGVFEDAVRDAVSRWRFEPGRLAGEAVAAWVVMPITFDLSGGRR